MRKTFLVVLLGAAVFASGCYTKAYVRELKAQQSESAQSNTNTNQSVGQASAAK
jgi:hypothetical protein